MNDGWEVKPKTVGAGLTIISGDIIDSSGVTNQAIINVQQLQEELNNYKEEAKKIPKICFYERNEDGAWTYECRKNKSGCPAICPKNNQSNLYFNR